MLGALVLLWSGAGVATAVEGSADEPVAIVSMGLPAPGDTRVTALADRAVLRAFHNDAPGISVEPFVMPQVAGSAMDSGPLMAIAAGMPPHAVYVNFRQSSTYIGQGFLEPVDVLLARLHSDNPDTRRADADGRWLADPTSDEVAAAVEAIRARTPGPAWEVVYRPDEAGRSEASHAWAVPTGLLVQTLLYRKDHFAAAGLDPDRPPRDWDELLDYARRLTVPQRRQAGLVFGEGMGASFTMYNLLASTGMRAVSRDEAGRWEATFATRGAAEATYFIWRLLREPYERDGRTLPAAAVTETGAGIGLRWDRGQISMRFADLDQEMLGSINPHLVGLAPPPVGPNGKRAAQVNSAMLGVFAGATPQEKLAAMRYVWFVSGDEAQRIRTRVYVEGGYGPFVSPELLERFGYQRELERVPPGWQEVFRIASDAGVPEPYGRNTQNIYRYLSEPINEALTRDYLNVPAEQAIDDIHRLLQDAEDDVNRKVLGNLTPGERTVRRVVGSAVLLVVLLAFGGGFAHLWRYFGKASAEEHGPRGRGAWRRYAWGYVQLLPVLTLTVLWLYTPLGAGLVMSLTDYRLLLPSTFVGVDNFADVLFDERFWAGLRQTFTFVALMVGLGFWPPILLALLLDEVPTGTLKYTFRTVFYLPAIISGVIVMFLWKELYDPTPQGAINGLYLQLNALGPVMATMVKLVVAAVWLSLVGLLAMLPFKLDELRNGMRLAMWAGAVALLAVPLWPIVTHSEGVGGAFAQLAALLVGRFDLEPLRFIRNPDTAMFWVVVPTVWMHAGPGCLIYLAALKTVPSDLYEAADLDGAGNWHKVFYITLPRLKYLITIQFIFAVVAAFKGGTDFILAMTGGGPNGATTILALEIFVRTFFELEFGMGAAMAWVLGALLIGLTSYQLKLLAHADFATAR